MSDQEQELYMAMGISELESENATLRTRLAAVEESLEFARNYSGIEGRPCPLCTYEDGVFIKSCQMHADLALALSVVAAAAETFEVAELRGETDLPHPSNSTMEWTARMQTAWIELHIALTAHDKAKP